LRDVTASLQEERRNVASLPRRADVVKECDVAGDDLGDAAAVELGAALARSDDPVGLVNGAAANVTTIFLDGDLEPILQL
jgi:hypothetical protein